MVAEWAHTFPPDVIGIPPTCVAVADAYVRSSDWQRLREFLDGHSWAEWDYLRRAFLARTLERSGEAEESAQQWKDGISAARSRADARERLESMVRLAISCGWEQRAQEVMWSMANSPSCPRWMLAALWSIAIENSETAQLQKLPGILAKVDPKSVALRNSYAFFSRLVRSEDGDPHHEAKKLFNENPGNATIAVTRGLSLFQQGKVAEALAATSSLPSAELEKPGVALFHGIFLTATGEADKAAGFLKVAEKRKMFPEEKPLLERARLTAEKAADASDLAETAKVARATRAAQTAEADAAVEAARAARAAKAAEPPKDAVEKEIAAAVKARMAERAARTAEADADVEAARAVRAAEAAKNGTAGAQPSSPAK